MRNHIRYPDKGVSHCVDCGYGAFCKRSQTSYTVKLRCTGSYAEVYNQC